MNRRNRAWVAFGVSFSVIFMVIFYPRKDFSVLQQVSGQTMGTIVYNVKFTGPLLKAIKSQIDRELKSFNQSLSTYVPDSEISRLNQQGFLTFESKYFLPVLKKSKEVYEKTGGAFDPSIGLLVQAWGFGPDKSIPDPAIEDSLKRIIGFDQVVFSDESVTVPHHFQMDFSAIAKGYAVDLIGELLEEAGIENYLVEIGGEVRCRGVNEENKSWSLGIEDPVAGLNERRLMAIVRLKDRALATSGNYRNYYEKDGKTYTHIIDPRTGYTTRHHLLSVSVFASDCMTADAYATAFMVLGLESSKQVLSQEGLDAIFFYKSRDGTIKSFVSEGIKPFLKMNKANELF